jgi:glycosyltransferase involved in cell wall biosynthesis
VPQVSVVIPVYNDPVQVSRAIESALGQTLTPLEVIVVDDGSLDSTPQALSKFAVPVRVMRQANAGPATARNNGAAAARGEYLAFLDADDEWRPEMLRELINALETNRDAVVCFCDYELIDRATGKSSRSHAGRAPAMEDLLSRFWAIANGAMVMRRSAFQACGGFDTSFVSPGFEDSLMWMRLRELGPFEYVPEPLLIVHGDLSLAGLIENERNREHFLQVIAERYGSRARPLARWINRPYGITFMQQALAAIDASRWADARLGFRRALRLAPGAVAGAVTTRLFRPKNLRRAWKLVFHNQRL